MKARILIGKAIGPSVSKPIKTISISTKYMEEASDEEIVEILKNAVLSALEEVNMDMLMGIFQEENDKIPEKAKDREDKAMRLARKKAPRFIFKE